MSKTTRLSIRTTKGKSSCRYVKEKEKRGRVIWMYVVGSTASKLRFEQNYPCQSFCGLAPERHAHHKI
jgi:hypothetical protein